MSGSIKVVFCCVFGGLSAFCFSRGLAYLSTVGKTRAGLTSGFGMGPGDHRDYGRQNPQTIKVMFGGELIFVLRILRVLWISLWIAMVWLCFDQKFLAGGRLVRVG